ncbi:MAG: CdaR family protein, partial [Candidatus Granulicatella sp. P6S_S16_bin.50.1]|nr:CdaR family protein [Candidatus Granulicatella sp. P6S_S16_bin.50.1]
MAEWMNRKSFLLVMSFILTIFLFALATDANGGLRSSSLNPQSSSNTITNVPIYVDINSDEYAVTGLPDSVALRLEGPNSLILSTTGNGTYRVKTPNLTELGEGKHTITLEVTGLPTGVHGIVSPETVEINIEKITTKEVPVVVKA